MPTLAETLISVWQQALAEKKRSIQIGPHTYSVGITRTSRLRTVEFPFEGHRFAGIEQNKNDGRDRVALTRRSPSAVRRRLCAQLQLGDQICREALTAYSPRITGWLLSSRRAPQGDIQAEASQ